MTNSLDRSSPTPVAGAGPLLVPEALPARVLCVAGSDCSGGAGIQADLKTLTALGVYGSTAVTAVTVQSSRGVSEVMPVPASVVGAQMDAVLDDLGADVVKTGMLVNVDVVRAVAQRLRRVRSAARLIIDPVVLASDGRELLTRDGVRALLEELLPMAALVTPNVPEAEFLTGVGVTSLADAGRAADVLLALGAAAVLIKGGHLPGAAVTGESRDVPKDAAPLASAATLTAADAKHIDATSSAAPELAIDLLRTADGEEFRFEAPRVVTRATHGTGCTLASAIAAGIAEGYTLRDAVQRAKDYLTLALRVSPQPLTGQGPLWHALAQRSV